VLGSGMFLTVAVDGVRDLAEAAQLLGYGDHASYVLEDLMAKAPANVLEFINKLSGTQRLLDLRDWPTGLLTCSCIFSQGGAVGAPGVEQDDRSQESHRGRRR
jgi:hypothetical protein